MRKKILVINASKRKKNTYNILLQIIKILRVRGFDIEILQLFDYDLKDCTGCESCITHKDCTITDDMKEVKSRIIASDGVIFGTPVYMDGVSSKLKTFADRSFDWFHKPETAGKPIMLVATAGATGLKEVRRFAETFAINIAARRGGFVGRTEKNIRKPVKVSEISRFLKLLTRDKSTYRPNNREIITFNLGKAMANKSIGDDKLFWRERNWLTKLYYYPCKMGLLKRIFSKIMFRSLTKAMK